MAFHRRSSHSFFSVVAVRVTIARKGRMQRCCIYPAPFPPLLPIPSIPDSSSFSGEEFSRGKKKKRGEIDRFEWSKLGKLRLLDHLCERVFESSSGDRRKEKRREELLILGADRVSYAWGRVTHSVEGGGASDERRLREEARFVEV